MILDVFPSPWSFHAPAISNFQSLLPMGTLSLIREARIYNREKTASPISGVEKTGQPRAKE